MLQGRGLCLLPLLLTKARMSAIVGKTKGLVRGGRVVRSSILARVEPRGLRAHCVVESSVRLLPRLGNVPRIRIVVQLSTERLVISSNPIVAHMVTSVDIRMSSEKERVPRLGTAPAALLAVAAAIVADVVQDAGGGQRS